MARSRIAGLASAALLAGCAAPLVASGQPSSPAGDTSGALAVPIQPAIVLDGGEGTPVAFPLHETHRLADAASNSAAMSFWEIGVPAGAAGAPPHTHAHEDEIFYVRTGTVTFMTGEARETVSAGGFAMLPRGGLHALWNAGTEDAILLVGTSDGAFDDFFDAVAMEVAATGAVTPPEIGALVGRLGAERGIIIDMTKVPDDIRPLYGLPPLPEAGD